MLPVQQGLKDEDILVPMTKLCQWFGVERRTTYYKPTRSPAKVKPELAGPIKEMVLGLELEPLRASVGAALLEGVHGLAVRDLLLEWADRQRLVI